MDNHAKHDLISTRDLSFSSEPFVVSNLSLVVGNKASRREVLVEIRNAGSISVDARDACDGSKAWNLSLPREKGVFCVALDDEISVVGLAIREFFSVQVLTLRGVLFLELSRNDDESWNGSAISREFPD